MIISASRRTDIPSYYSDWFFRRLRKGFVYVRNPRNAHQVSKISLSPEVVDGIVFWTKNPVPMMDRLCELEKYPYYFQFTVTSYGPEIERNLPSKNKVILPAFQRLSREIGKEKVIWRYDPIFFNETYTAEYHCRYFEALASKLAPYTERCTVSFVDFYRNTRSNQKLLRIQPMSKQQQTDLLGRFAEIAKQYHLCIDICAEAGDYSGLGILPAHCIEKERLERIGGYRLEIGKDKNQRSGCGCVESIDIGVYNTCRNNCLYCYANYNHAMVAGNFGRHHPDSPLLVGEPDDTDEIKERSVRSYVDGQMTLF